MFLNARVSVETLNLKYRAVHLNTFLFCECLRGVAVFKSDNISTISILKEYLSKAATEQRVQVNFNFGMKVCFSSSNKKFAMSLPLAY